ncbi:MAG: DnaJ C-terminal domain-containing protein [Candidatus Eisenbacteria bacterium]
MRDFGGGGFGDFFGGGGGAGAGTRGPARGRDIQIRLPLEIQEIAAGAEKKIKVRLQAPCETCGATGAKPGTEARACSTCHGTGEVRQMQQSFLGRMVNIAPCPTCRGEGTRIEAPCGACGGDGRKEQTRTVAVKIPAGVSTGNYIPLRGKGNAGPRGGPPGDLIVVIEEKPHRTFERHGDDVLCDVSISFDQAALGDSIEVPTLDGRAKMNIPGGTPSGKIFRLRGKGIPHLRGRSRGDELVRVHVHVPKKLSKEEQAALEEIRGKGLFHPES